MTDPVVNGFRHIETLQVGHRRHSEELPATLLLTHK